jgi:D-beta-D-heptose 7-phosphate kinase/D-beta-D-heptose 1-phosphate adenosyltransferase
MVDILVIGDIMLDQYIIGDCTRISPEAPVPVVDVNRKYQTLGGAANVATNLASLGVKVGIIGRIGKDDYGKTVLEKFKEKGISDFSIIQGETIVKTRIISGNQQIVRLDQEKYQEFDETESERVISSVEKYNGKYILISDYGKGVVSDDFMKELRKAIDKKECKLIIDPKGKNWSKYQNSYLVKPNLKELIDISNIEISNEDHLVADVAEKTREAFNIDNLLTTRAAKGMTLTNKAGSQHFSTKKVEVFDVSGAGDTSLAVIAYMLNEGKSLETAIEYSNLASSYVITKKGTYAISKEEFDLLIH